MAREFQGQGAGTVWCAAYAADMAKTPSIEKCFELIEESVEALEGDDLSLDAALGKYEAGLKYLRLAKKQLDSYEERLETLNASIELEGADDAEDE